MSINKIEIVDKLSPSDFENICRTCLCRENLTPLYDCCNYDDICLIEMLMSCTFVKYSENDGLPNQICEKCINQLFQVYEFSKQCEIVDGLLRDCKRDNNNETNKKECQITYEQLNDNYQEINDSKITEIELDIVHEKNNIKTENDINFKSKEQEKNSLSCKICDITFAKPEELQEHRIKVKHIRPKIPCPVCNNLYSSNSMKVHMRIHTKERPFQCLFCSKAFTIKRNLDRHIMIHTGERPYACHICNKGFIQLVTLQDHLAVHSIEKPFICNICGESYKKKIQLKMHERKHCDAERQEAEHECPICHKRYYSKSVLSQHKIIHEDKKFLCSDCGLGFSRKATLAAHSKIHTGEKPYSCDICNKSFSHNGTLLSHILTHTGEKPYSCFVCNKAFTQSSHLRYHMRTHNGERPYSCSICAKSFALKGNLRVHSRIHTGETPFVCPICGKGFYDSSSMTKHKRNHDKKKS